MSWKLSALFRAPASVENISLWHLMRAQKCSSCPAHCPVAQDDDHVVVDHHTFLPAATGGRHREATVKTTLTLSWLFRLAITNWKTRA